MLLDRNFQTPLAIILGTDYSVKMHSYRHTQALLLLAQLYVLLDIVSGAIITNHLFSVAHWSQQ